VRPHESINQVPNSVALWREKVLLGRRRRERVEVIAANDYGSDF